MTDLTTSTVTGAAPTTSVAQTAATESQEAAISDFNDFLTLLTAQLQNQDPLSPLDSTQFVEQLASFSQVEQAVNTNTKLDTLIDQMAGGDLTELASWVGREIQAAGVDFRFNGSELSIDVPSESSANSASVVIRDQEGREVATLAAPTDGGQVTWDGRTSSGGSAEAGLYQVEFVYGFGEPGTPEAESLTRQAEGSGRVQEVRVEDGQTVLVLEGGLRVLPSDVTAVIDPQVATPSDDSEDSLLDSAVEAVEDVIEDAAETVVDTATDAADDAVSS